MSTGIYLRNKKDFKRLKKQGFQKKSIPWNKGKKGLFKHLEQTKQKISRKLQDIKRKPFSKEHKRKMSIARKKRIITQKTKDKMKKIMIGRKITWGNKISKAKKGHFVSLEIRKKISCSKRKINQKDFNNFITPIHKREYHSFQYKNWRRTIFIRDDFTCQKCGQRYIYLEAHHIKNFAHYPNLRFDINNGITLCKDCHKLTDNYKGKTKGQKLSMIK